MIQPAFTRLSGRGKTTVWGDGIERNLSESWQKALRENDRLYIPDGNLLQRMEALFDTTFSGFFGSVKRIRSAYNIGKLRGMKRKPLYKSVRYEKRGKYLFEVTARGTEKRVLTGSRTLVRPVLVDGVATYFGRPTFEMTCREPGSCDYCRQDFMTREIIVNHLDSQHCTFLLHKRCAKRLGVVWQKIPKLKWSMVTRLKWQAVGRDGTVVAVWKDVKTDMFYALRMVGGKEVANVLDFSRNLTMAMSMAEEGAVNKNF